MMAIKERLTLSADRAIMLDRFLSDVGGSLFAADGSLSKRAALAQIRQAGQMPGGRDGGGTFGTQFVVTDKARLEVTTASLGCSTHREL